MKTGCEKARTALDMFCRAAEKATGDYWEIQRLENGDLAVVQTFKSAKEAIYSPKISDEAKKLMITGTLFCTSSGGRPIWRRAWCRRFGAGRLTSRRRHFLCLF